MVSESPAPLPANVDVLVVGGGPTGLLIANILLRSGLKVLVVGKFAVVRFLHPA
jgi:2-polyprenyl-6-methoxyphenol hydroxylase-like FAD-dependent oxidoreductase